MPNSQPTYSPRLLSFQNDQQQNQIEQNFEEKMLPNVFYEQVQGFEGLAVGDKIGQRQDYKLRHWPTGARRGCNFEWETQLGSHLRFPDSTLGASRVGILTLVL